MCLCGQAPRREGCTYQVRESEGSHSHSPPEKRESLSLRAGNTFLGTLGTWSEPVSGFSRAEKYLAIRERELSCVRAPWGDHACVGNAEEDSSPMAAPRTPAMIPLVVALPSSAGSPPSTQPWASLPRASPCVSLRTLPRESPPDTSLQAPLQSLYNGLCSFQITNCLTWFYFNQKDCTVSHYKHTEKCRW